MKILISVFTLASVALATALIFNGEALHPFGTMPTTFYTSGAKYISSDYSGSSWRSLMTKGRVPYHQLTAADFRVDDSIQSSNAVYTDGFVSYECSGNVWQIDHSHWKAVLTGFSAYSGLNRANTWRRSKMIDPSVYLQHEQGHLDLAELAGRTLAGLVAQAKPEGSGVTRAEAWKDLESKLAKLYADVRQQSDAEQQAYDRRTSSGWNKAEQAKVSSELSTKLSIAGVRSSWTDLHASENRVAPNGT